MRNYKEQFDKQKLAHLIAQHRVDGENYNSEEEREAQYLMHFNFVMNEQIYPLYYSVSLAERYNIPKHKFLRKHENDTNGTI